MFSVTFSTLILLPTVSGSSQSSQVCAAVPNDQFVPWNHEIISLLTSGAPEPVAHVVLPAAVLGPVALGRRAALVDAVADAPEAHAVRVGLARHVVALLAVTLLEGRAVRVRVARLPVADASLAADGPRRALNVAHALLATAAPANANLALEWQIHAQAMMNTS